MNALIRPDNGYCRAVCTKGHYCPKGALLQGFCVQHYWIYRDQGLLVNKNTFKVDREAKECEERQAY